VAALRLRVPLQPCDGGADGRERVRAGRGERGLAGDAADHPAAGHRQRAPARLSDGRVSSEAELGRGHSWFDRHPPAGDAPLAVVILALAATTLDQAPAAAVVVSVLLVAPLVARRRAPVAVFAAVMLACAAELVFVDEFLAATGAALVALCTLVAYAARRLAVLGYAIALAGAVAFARRSGYFDTGPRAGSARARRPYRSVREDSRTSTRVMSRGCSARPRGTVEGMSKLLRRLRRHRRFSERGYAFAGAPAIAYASVC
jgi:hypothetical protein